jgi:hypothetical protein
MAAGRTLTVSLVANTSSFRRGMMSAVRDTQGFQGKMTALGASMRGMLGPAMAAAGAAAAAFAAKLAVDGVQAAAAEADAIAKLSNTLNNLNQGFALTGLEEFIDKTQRATGVADDQLRPALDSLVRSTRSASEAQELLTLALDVSAGTGESLSTVSEALGRAYNGQTRGLKRLVPSLDAAALKSGDMVAITEELSTLFSGAASTAAGTWAGKVKRLEVAGQELIEAFGEGFLSAFGDGEDAIEGVLEMAKEMEPTLRALGEQVGYLTRMIADMGPVAQGVFKGLLDLTGPVLDAIMYFYRVIGLGEDPMEAAKNQFFGIETAGKGAADGITATADAAAAGQQPVGWFAEDMAGLADEAREAAENFDLVAAAISRTNAVVSYQKALDDVRKTFKDNNGEVTIFNNKGRELVDSLVDMAGEAATAADSTTDLGEQAAIGRTALDTLAKQLGKTKMDPTTQAALLGPFQALIDDLDEAGVDVGELQTQLNNLKSKSITVTTYFVNKGDYTGTPPPGGYQTGSKKNKAMGGYMRGFSMGTHLSDSIPAMLSRGEYVVRASSVAKLGLGFMDAVNMGRVPAGAGGSGVTIGTLNVTSAPGERAEDSVPRSLRRLAFVAGLNV